MTANREQCAQLIRVMEGSFLSDVRINDVTGWEAEIVPEKLALTAGKGI